MSVQAASGAGAPWQVLAEMRAARAGATDPAASQTGAAAAGTATGAAPQPGGLLQFLQNIESSFGGSDSTPTATTASATANTTTTSDSDPVGKGISKILAELQSLFTQIQQGFSGTSSDASTATTTAATATPATNTTTSAGLATGTIEAGAPQTGNDLALQFLNGFPASAWPAALV